MKWNSLHWQEDVGVCTRHMLPEIPCPSCMAELEQGTDDGMYVEISEVDRLHEAPLSEGFIFGWHSTYSV